MTDAALHHDMRAMAAPQTAPRNAGQSARFPNRITINLDDQLLHAIQAAAEIEKEPEGVVVRRWLRAAARQLQLLPNEVTNGR